MPGNSWQNLRRGARPSASGTSSNTANGGTNSHSGTHGSARDQRLGRAPTGINPQLDALMRQRKDLEDNLQNLVSGTTSNEREAARFHVPTFAQRQAQQRQWEQQREQMQQARAEQQGEQPSFMPFRRQAWPSRSEQLRTGLRNFQQPVSEWMEERDNQRQRLRSRFDRADQGVKRATRPLRNLGDQVGSASQQLRDLDQKLASEGLDSDREELRNLGADKILRADKTLQKVNSAIDAPSRAVKKIDDFWQKRDNEISGAMDRFGPYVENSRRRLSLDQGGSGDLFERMQRNRERALERRREQRREQMRDQARRDRALQRKKEKDEEDV